MQPVIKWPGGKRQLVDELFARVPKSFSHYCEPFFGAGAVFFALRASGWNGPATLGDLNPDTVALHRALRDECEDLIAAFGKYVASYAATVDSGREEFYYEVRNGMRYAESNCQRGARLLFLNRTGFNGLYRVNRQGGYNVPFGDMADPNVRADDLRLASRALQGTRIECCSFDAFPVPELPAFFYLDPPYAPHDGKKDAFVAYTAAGFDEEDQKRLARWATGLAERGHDVMASNHDCTLIRLAWSSFRIETVGARRKINRNADGRGEVAEVILRRYCSDQGQLQVGADPALDTARAAAVRLPSPETAVCTAVDFEGQCGKRAAAGSGFCEEHQGAAA